MVVPARTALNPCPLIVEDYLIFLGTGYDPLLLDEVHGPGKRGLVSILIGVRDNGGEDFHLGDSAASPKRIDVIVKLGDGIAGLVEVRSE